MEYKSYAEQYGVQPGQEVFIVGTVMFSALAKKDTKLRTPLFYVRIKNPQYYNADGSQQGNFIDAVKAAYEKKSKTGTISARPVFKDSAQKPFVEIYGHEEGTSVPANQLLIRDDGAEGYLTSGQTIKACINSYSFNHNGNEGVSQGLNYIEIPSIKHPSIGWLQTKPDLNKGFNPFK